jgi:predicted oxidoreductase
MKTYKIPRTDLVVSRIAYGTAANGVEGAVQRSGDFMPRTVRALHTAYDCGVTLYDLADVYGAGRSEIALREWFRQAPGVRDKVVIQSKCGLRLPDGWLPGDQVAPGTFYADLTHGHVVSAVERSLKRLGIDCLDILLLHVPDFLVQPEQLAQAFDALEAAGKVRHFGVSNYSCDQIELLQQVVRQPLIVNQIRLGLAYYAPLAVPLTELQYSDSTRVVDYCRARQVQVQAFSPLREDSIYETPALLRPVPNAPPAMKELTQLLRDAATKHDCTPAAIMLAWLLRHPAEIVPVIGSMDPKHIEECCRADSVQLSRPEWYALLHGAAPLQPKTVPEKVGFTRRDFVAADGHSR